MTSRVDVASMDPEEATQFLPATSALGAFPPFLSFFSASLNTPWPPLPRQTLADLPLSHLTCPYYSALAVMSTSAADVGSASLEGLGQDEIDTLNQWIAKFESKYPVVGTLTQAKH